MAEQELETMEELEEFDISELQEMETTTIDFDQFEGTKAKIEGMKAVRVPSQFHKSGKADALRIWTEAVGDIVLGDNKTPLKASMLFNLKVVDKDGVRKIGWSSRGKLAELLLKKGVKHPSELKGEDVTLTLRVKKVEGSKFPKKYLGFQ